MIGFKSIKPNICYNLPVDVSDGTALVVATTLTFFNSVVVPVKFHTNTNINNTSIL